MKKVKKILDLLTENEIKSGILLYFMILIMAFLEMLGVFSILPFIAVLTNPELIETNLILNQIFESSKIFGIKNSDNFLFALGISVFILLIVSLIFKSFTTYFQLKYVQMRSYSIGMRLVRSYINQPYNWFLNKNSSNLGKNILSEVDYVVSNGLHSLIELISKTTVAIVIILLIILVDPNIAFMVGLVLSLSYSIIFFFIKNFLNRLGKVIFKNNSLRFIALNEGFGAIKEVKLGRLEQIFISRFSEPAKLYAENVAISSILKSLPRYALEALSFGGVMLILLYMMSKSGNFVSALPVISLYVMAGYRLMPAVQQIYASVSQLTTVGPSLDAIHKDIKNLVFYDHSRHKENKLISLNKKISLISVNFRYPYSSKLSLKDISINIPAKSIVGFIGTTGSGKTTLIDLILGLLLPENGYLKIDEKIITQNNVSEWQKIIGYVPQNIYLSDDTISSNIAFGVKPENIKKDIIEKVSKYADLHQFVTNELPKKYDTTIGERGVRLSGGQRQRIGIARALYHNPKVLILDEATSSLDIITEKLVMERINDLRRDMTIIIVAHRLNTVKDCDLIFKLEKGKIINQGTFDELIKENYNITI